MQDIQQAQQQLLHNPSLIKTEEFTMSLGGTVYPSGQIIRRGGCLSPLSSAANSTKSTIFSDIQYIYIYTAGSVHSNVRPFLAWAGPSAKFTDCSLASYIVHVHFIIYGVYYLVLAPKSFKENKLSRRRQNPGMTISQKV